MWIKTVLITLIAAEPAQGCGFPPIHGRQLQAYWAEQNYNAIDLDLFSEEKAPKIKTDHLSYRIERDASGIKIEEVKIDSSNADETARGGNE